MSNSFKSLFNVPASPAPVMDQEKEELDKEIAYMNQHLSTEFLNTMPTFHTDDFIDYLTRQKQVNILNRLKTANCYKEGKLGRLQLTIRTLKKQQTKREKTSIGHRSNKETQKSQFQRQLNSYQDKNTQQQQIQDTLKLMLSKYKKSVIVWKERAQNLNQIYLKLVKNYDKLMEAQNIAKNESIMAQNQVISYQNHLRLEREQFEHKLEEKKWQLEDCNVEIQQYIAQISQNNIIIQHFRNFQEQQLGNLEANIQTLKSLKQNERGKLSALKVYRTQIKHLQKALSVHGMIYKIQEPIDLFQVEEICQLYNNLAYQESSLNIQYLNLTQNFQKKSEECEKISIELAQLKEDCYLDSKPKRIKSISQIKSDVDSIKLLQFGKYNALDKDELVQRIYFFFQNTIDKVMKAADNIVQYQSSYGEGLQSVYQQVRQNLQNTISLFSQKPESTLMISQKRPTQKWSMTEVKLEQVGLSQKQQFPLTKADIYLAVEKVFGGIYKERIYQTIQKNPIVKYFIDTVKFTAFLQNFAVPEHAFESLQQLNQQGHSIIRKQFLDLSKLVLQLLVYAKDDFELIRKEIYEFYNKRYPLKVCLLEKALQSVDQGQNLELPSAIRKLLQSRTSKYRKTTTKSTEPSKLVGEMMYNQRKQFRSSINRISIIRKISSVGSIGEQSSQASTPVFISEYEKIAKNQISCRNPPTPQDLLNELKLKQSSLAYLNKRRKSYGSGTFQPPKRVWTSQSTRNLRK